MTSEPSALRSRRSVLAAALGGLGAAIAARIASPDATRAAAGDPVTVDGSFTGSGTTRISSSVSAPAAALSGDATGTGHGVRGTSVDHVGVIGAVGNLASLQAPPDTGVFGYADAGANGYGIVGQSNVGTGIYGSGDTAVAAHGTTNGLFALGRVAVTGQAFITETGVFGFVGEDDAPTPPAGVGVQATAETTAQIALNVTGKAKFSRSGRTSFAANTSSKKVTMGGVSTASFILATLQTKRTGIYVIAVVPAAGYFTIYLNKAVSSTTYVGYFVIN